MPTDTTLQSLAQGGPMVAALLFLACILCAGAFTALGVWLERREREHQRQLARSEFRARSGGNECG